MPSSKEAAIVTILMMTKHLDWQNTQTPQEPEQAELLGAPSQPFALLKPSPGLLPLGYCNLTELTSADALQYWPKQMPFLFQPPASTEHNN